MKSKYTTYILIVIVIVLWGIIIRKVFFSNDSPAEYIMKEEKDRPAPPEEKSVLTLDYRDPFIPMRKELPPTPQSPPNRKPGQTIPVNLQERSDIRFAGRVKNGNKVNLIVSHRGEYFTLAEGGEIGGFVFVKSFGDSLVFSREGTNYYLKTAE